MIYIEHQESIEAPNGSTYYGYIVLPGEEPRTLLIVSSADHAMQLGALIVDLSAGAANCNSPHDGPCSADFHTAQAPWAFALESGPESPGCEES